MFVRSDRVADFDAELWSAIQAENRRQEEHIELIASENYTSPRVMELQGTQLTNKYAEGYPHKRYYGRLRACRFGRTVGHRSGQAVVWCGLRQCAAPLGFVRQLGSLYGAVAAG